MYIKKIVGRIIPYQTKVLLDTFKPITLESTKWKRWVTYISTFTCPFCFNQNGKILSIDEKVKIPVHNHCHCELITKISVESGTATNDGKNGADYYLKYYGRLPNYYISVSEAKKLGWKNILGNLDEVAPGKQLTKGIYRNYNKHLPDDIGRVWYEADINYTNGYRNSMRIVYSNDGLIFVTYDHYRTFYEII